MSITPAAILPEFWEALRQAKGKDASASNIQRVAKATSSDAASWAFTQWELRKRAQPKFEKASEMLFTREALEQSTGKAIAEYHASQFPKGERVADLTCGIGGDIISLAQRGPAIGFETDSERAEYTRHNLSVYGLEAEIRETSCLEVNWDFEYAIADPARRIGGRRTANPDDFAPNPVLLVERLRQIKLGLIKLSPMLKDDFLESFGGILEFISFGGECREALVRLGQSPIVAARRAVHIESGQCLPASSEPPPTTETPKTYVFEADPAAIRAHCLGTLADLHGLYDLAETNGYLTGSHPVDSPWMRCWKVESEPFSDIKQVKAALETLASNTPVVKSRGVDIDPAEVQKKLRLKGNSPYTVFTYTVGKKVRYVVGRAVNQEKI